VRHQRHFSLCGDVSVHPLLRANNRWVVQSQTVTYSDSGSRVKIHVQMTARSHENASVKFGYNTVPSLASYLAASAARGDDGPHTRATPPGRILTDCHNISFAHPMICQLDKICCDKYEQNPPSPFT